ncbi:MAG: OmpH family outer membrane protein [Elusimicrobiota bacterium]
MRIKIIRYGLFCLFILTAVLRPAWSVMITSTRIAYIDIEKVFNEMTEVKNARNEINNLITRRLGNIEEIERAIASVRNKISKDTSVKKAEKKAEEPEKDDGLIQEDAEDAVPGENTVTADKETADTETADTEPPAGDESGEAAPDAGMPDSSSYIRQAEKIPDFEIKELNEILKQKEMDLKELMEQSKKLLKEKEKELKYKIMGKIYDTVNNVAEKKGFTVIMDKEVILFSEESVVDITDEIIRILNESLE